MSRSREILEGAEALTEQLRVLSPPTTRTIFLNLVEGAETDREALLHRLKLASTGSGGHLGRTGSYPQQLQEAAKLLRKELTKRDDLKPKELASCLGWVGRLLYVADQQAGSDRDGAAQNPRGRSRPEARPSRGGATTVLPGDDVPSDRKAVQPGKLGLSGEALGGLAELKRRLQED